MPMYSYSCEKCGKTADKLRKLEERDEPIKCGDCGGDAIRVIAQTAPPKFSGPGFTPKFH